MQGSRATNRMLRIACYGYGMNYDNTCDETRSEAVGLRLAALRVEARLFLSSPVVVAVLTKRPLTACPNKQDLTHAPREGAYMRQRRKREQSSIHSTGRYISPFLLRKFAVLACVIQDAPPPLLS
jgi:hypothetical protein